LGDLITCNGKSILFFTSGIRMRKYMNKCFTTMKVTVKSHFFVCASKLKNMFKKSEKTVCRMKRNHRFQNICSLYKGMWLVRAQWINASACVNIWTNVQNIFSVRFLLVTVYVFENIFMISTWTDFFFIQLPGYSD
jgi:hypothetical protein